MIQQKGAFQVPVVELRFLGMFFNPKRKKGITSILTFSVLMNRTRVYAKKLGNWVDSESKLHLHVHTVLTRVKMEFIQ